jgi:hypothetical protein
MCQIVWYGERGIINALVTELRCRGVDATKQFLNAIVWADGGTPQWIEDVTSVTFVVEIGLFEFGSPDLVLVCRTDRHQNPPFFVLVEVKAAPYAVCAMPNRVGMVDGFNSSINGQLSLKYRFSCALAAWNGGVIEEPAALYAAYVQPPDLGGLGDPAPSRRHLAKFNVREILGNIQLQQLPIEQCHLVAWTHDAQPYWDQAVVGEQDLLPRFLLPLPNNNNIDEAVAQSAWDQLTHRVGWIGFGAITEKLSPGDGYKKAVKTMIRHTMIRHEIPQGQQAPADLQGLATINLANFSADMQNLLATIELVAVRVFGANAVKRRAGSYSIKYRGRVIVKLVPQNPNDPDEHLLLGLSNLLEPRTWCEPAPPRPVEIGGQPFLVLRVELDDVAGTIATVDAIFQQVIERLEREE